MPTKYLLPCSCGATLPIELGQAGQLLTCQCGTVINVPKMREIAKLKCVDVAESVRPRANWSRVQGVLFSGGILLTVASLLIAAYFGYGWSQIPILSQPTETDTDAWVEKVLAKMSPDELIGRWHELESGGLGQWYPPEHVVARELRAVLLRNAYYALAVAAVGLCLTVSSLVLNSSPPKRV